MKRASFALQHLPKVEFPSQRKQRAVAESENG
jgi:hypothetical protein